MIPCWLIPRAAGECGSHYLGDFLNVIITLTPQFLHFIFVL